MNLKIDTLGQYMRVGIYIVAFVVFLVMGLRDTVADDNNNTNSKDINLFWPPDMVPHPHLPPLDDDEGRNWAHLDTPHTTFLCCPNDGSLGDNPPPVAHLQGFYIPDVDSPPNSRFTPVNA